MHADQDALRTMSYDSEGAAASRGRSKLAGAKLNRCYMDEFPDAGVFAHHTPFFPWDSALTSLIQALLLGHLGIRDWLVILNFRIHGI